MDRDSKVPGSCHLCFGDIESEALLFLLEQSGIYASAASSCSSGAQEPSHVLAAMGFSRELARGSLRLSLGYASAQSDVDKVLDIVPGLQHLTIKGGEPFADPNNIKILQKIADTNPDCRVEICTNFQLVSDDVINILHRINEVHVQASIDGTYDLYNWIRGGNFEKTVDNINRYHAIEGRKVVIVSTISIYNWMNIVDLIDYWKKVPPS